MNTFNARISPIASQEIEAEIVGQIAIHPAYSAGGTPDTSRWCLSHVKSGYYFYECDGGTLLEELKRLAGLLAAFDFDAYFASQCTDTAFVADVKAVIERWEWSEVVLL
jgi:hypothetical protein